MKKGSVTLMNEQTTTTIQTHMYVPRDLKFGFSKGCRHDFLASGCVEGRNESNGDFCPRFYDVIKQTDCDKHVAFRNGGGCSTGSCTSSNGSVMEACVLRKYSIVYHIDKRLAGAFVSAEWVKGYAPTCKGWDGQTYTEERGPSDQHAPSYAPNKQTVLLVTWDVAQLLDHRVLQAFRDSALAPSSSTWSTNDQEAYDQVVATYLMQSSSALPDVSLGDACVNDYLNQPMAECAVSNRLGAAGIFATQELNRLLQKNRALYDTVAKGYCQQFPYSPDCRCVNKKLNPDFNRAAGLTDAKGAPIGLSVSDVRCWWAPCNPGIAAENFIETSTRDQTCPKYVCQNIVKNWGTIKNSKINQIIKCPPIPPSSGSSS